MNADDGGTEPERPDPSILPPGPRRSTYVPPAVTTPAPGLFAETVGATRAPARSPDADESVHDESVDDDVLLSAFEAETAQLLPGTGAQATRSSLADLPAPTGPPVVFAEPSGVGSLITPELPTTGRSSSSAERPSAVAPGRHSALSEPDVVPTASRSDADTSSPAIPRDWEPEVTASVTVPPPSEPVGDDTADPGSASELPPPSPLVEPFAAPPPVIYELVEPVRPPSGLPRALVLPAADPGTDQAEPERNETPQQVDPDDPLPLSGEAEAPDRAFEELVFVPAVATPGSSLDLPASSLVGDADGREATGVGGPRGFVVEASGIEPTPTDVRVGRAVRLFWLWFAANSSILSVAFGAVILSLGMSLRQATVAVFLGVVASFVPLGLTARSGKWSGQPTMITSRATFGLVGNILPAVIALITRVFWGGVLLWLVGLSTARILVASGLGGAYGETTLTAAIVAVGFVLALGVGILGYGMIARIQLGLSAASAVLVIGFIALTSHAVDLRVALTVADGPWILVVTGTVLVFSFLGLVWAQSGSDLARYQRPSSSGAAAMVWGPLGAVAAPLVLVAYGALLAASDRKVAAGLISDPLGTVGAMLPGWYPVPLVAATALSLLSGVVVALYSGGFALQAVGLRVHRAVATAVVGVLILGVAILIALSPVDVLAVFRDLATTLAVPVAAWAGILTAELMLRRRRFDTPSLLARGGVYPDVNWVNLGALIVASAIGYGFTTAGIGWLDWQGYLFRAFGVSAASDLGGTDIGVLAALALGALAPFAAGARAVRAQERSASPVSQRFRDRPQN